MADERTAPIFFFAPFVSSTMTVEPSWIDYNGHMNMAYYHVLFDRAVDEAFEVVGLGPDYVAERNASYFVAEVHTLYRRELKAQRAGTRDAPAHRLRRETPAFLSGDPARDGGLGRRDLRGHVPACRYGDKKVTPFPADILANLAVMKAAHTRLPPPKDIGRVIGLPQREHEVEERLRRRDAALEAGGLSRQPRSRSKALIDCTRRRWRGESGTSYSLS